MNKNIIIGILGAAVVALAVIVAFLARENRRPVPPDPEDPPIVNGEPTNSTNTANGASSSKTPDSEPEKPEDQPPAPPPPPPPPSPPQTNQPPVSVERELPSVKKGDVARLPRKDEPQDLTTLFEATGRGTLAAGGGAGDVDFYYLMKTVATSRIEDKEEFDSGKIRVEEIRTFSEATEIMAVSNVNLRVDLSTLRWMQSKTRAISLVLSPRYSIPP